MEYIRQHKRLGGYDEMDYDLLRRLISLTAGVIFTPNVLTEASNLLRHAKEPVRTEIARVLSAFIRHSDERFVSSREAIERAEYLKLGLTDSVLLKLAATGAGLLTADLGLYLAASRAGFNAINFNHVRERRPDFNPGRS